MKGKLTIAAIVAVFFFSSCSNSGDGDKNALCDTVCQKDSIKFRDEQNKFRPFVFISAKNCKSDSLKWGYSGSEKTIIDFQKYKLNKDFTRCYINDTSYAWLVFNLCETGRGYLLKLPYSENVQLFKSSAALNNFDPKFSVAEGIVAYTDRGNLFVEEMATQKKAMMTFGKETQMELDYIHDVIDSVNITPTRIWAKVKIDGEWKEIGKNITLK
jgi:hypothetical protein